MYTLFIFLAGAITAFLISDKALHERLRKAKDAQQAASLVGHAIAQHGKEVGHDVHGFVTSPGFQRTVKKGKRLARKTLHNVKARMQI